MSSFLVFAALIAAGGMGRFLWKYQARLDAPVPAPVAAATGQPLPEPTDAGANSTAETRFTQSPALAAEAAPLPDAAPIPIYAGGPTRHRAIRGDIRIVGRNRTTEAVAPATAEDVAPSNTYASSPSATANEGPRIYTPHDPNSGAAPAPTRSGKPRYYDFDTRQSRPDQDDSATFQRRTTVKQYR